MERGSEVIKGSGGLPRREREGRGIHLVGGAHLVGLSAGLLVVVDVIVLHKDGSRVADPDPAVAVVVGLLESLTCVSQVCR